MSDDYYSYRPLLQLDRPLTLVGIPGSEVGRTARAMNLMSGVPFVWLDRQVEHRLGRSVELVQREEGPAPRLIHERAVVDELLARGDKPIVAASDLTFSDPWLRERLEGHTDVVLLHVDVDTALALVERQAKDDARQHWALRQGGAASPATVRRALVEAERRVRHLSRVVLVRDRPPLAVAEDLLRSLGLPELDG